MKNIKKYKIKKQQIISIVFFAIIQLITLITPYIMGLIIDDYIPNNNLYGIVFGIITFVLIPFISVALQTLYNYFLIKYVRKKGNEMSIDIMKNLVYKENKFFDQENSLELLSYTSKEAVSYINFYISELARFYVYIIISVIIFIILLFLNPIIALIQLLYFPISYFPVKRIMKNVDREVQEIVKTNAEINQIKGDVFKAIEFIKLNSLENKKINEVEKHNNRINKIWGKVAALDTMSGIWSSGFVTVLFTGISFGLGALLVLNNVFDFQIGQLVSCITYTGLLYGHFNTILQTNINKKKKEAEFKKIFSYLELEGEREENQNKVLLTFNNSITFNNCNFHYNDDTPALNNLSIEFKKGQWTGIVGKSGSGKSTILDLIMKLYSVNDGMIYFDNTDINEINSFDIRNKITKITQDIYLFPGTIESNLKLVNENLKDYELEEVIKFVCLEEYISALPNGLKTDVGEAGKLMSGGEKQRLSLAMGLLRNNKVLLLDEVTASLDSVTEKMISINLKKLVDKGYTIISISHKEDFLKYCDVIYTIEDGKVININNRSQNG